MTVVAIGLAVDVFVQSDSLTPIELPEGGAPFRTALIQLGILYIVALFVERTLEVLIRAWRQSRKTHLGEKVRSAEESGKAAAEKKLQEYKVGTSHRFDTGDFGIGVRGPLAWPDLRVRWRRGVVSTGCASVHGHHPCSRTDWWRIGNNPRVDGTSR